MATSGRNTAFGIGIESTAGTAVSAALWLRAETWNDDPAAPQIAIQALHQGGAQFGRSAVNVQKSVSGSFTVRGHYDGGGLAMVLRTIFGGSWSTDGAGPYQHDLTIGATLPSFTLRPVYGDGVGGSTETGAVIAGCKVDSAEISIGTDDVMSVTVNWTGMTYTGGSAGTPSFGTDNAILPTSVGTLSWNSGTYTMNSLTLSVSNGLQVVRQLGSATATALYQVNERSCRLQFEHLRTDDTFQTAHLALTESDATLSITSGDDQLDLVLYNARVEDSVPHNIGDTALVVESVALRGRDDGTNDTFTLTLTNGDSSAEAS